MGLLQGAPSGVGVEAVVEHVRARQGGSVREGCSVYVTVMAALREAVRTTVAGKTS